MGTTTRRVNHDGDFTEIFCVVSIIKKEGKKTVVAKQKSISVASSNPNNAAYDWEPRDENWPCCLGGKDGASQSWVSVSSCMEKRADSTFLFMRYAVL